MVASLEIDVGTAVLEGGCDVEDEGKEDVAMSVDIAPVAVVANRGEAFGELEGLVEVERDGEIALEVDETEAAVKFDECQAVVVDIFHAFGCLVVVVEREDGVSESVNDAPEIVFTDGGASVAEDGYFVVDAGDDFVAEGVEESLFAVTEDGNAAFGEVGDGKVVGRGKGLK